MLRRPHFIALACVLLLVLVLLNLPSQTSGKIKLALSGLFLPLFGLGNSAQTVANKSAQAITPRRVLTSEIDRLSKENQEFRIQLMQMNQLWAENYQLRQAVGWQRQTPWKMKLARVTTRDPANWWRSMQIDLGSEDGLRENLPVVTPDGLVGRVEVVGRNSARVLLLGDPNCKVAAMVEETREVGVIENAGGSVIDQSLIEMSLIPRNSTLRPGNKVITSGMGGVFPKGIPIGQVVDIRSVGFGLYLEARVRLSANLQTLEQVWVLLP